MPAPLIVGSGASATATGWTEEQYWRAIADQLGNLAILTLTATASISVTPDAKGLLTISTIATDGYLPERFDGYWLRVCNGPEAGEVRRVWQGSYDGVTGTLLLDRPFTDPLESGTEIELTDTFPARRYGETKGGREFINESLRLCTIEYRLALTGNGTRSTDLTSYGGYIDQDARIDSVWDQYGTIADDPLELVPAPVRVVVSGGAQTLVTQRTYSTSEEYDLRILRAGHTLIYSGGAWGSSTAGFTAINQAAAVPVPWVLSRGMVKALQAMTRRVRNDTTLDRAEKQDRIADLMRDRRRWAKVANLQASTEFPEPTIFASGFVALPTFVGDSPIDRATSLPVSSLA